MRLPYIPRCIRSQINFASTPGNTPDDQLLASLNARVLEISKESDKLNSRWRQGKCVSTLGLSNYDWIRRLALSWPRIVVGTSSGDVVLANIGAGNGGFIIGLALGAHPETLNDGDDDISLLHGQFDGGGVTAVTIDGLGSRMASGGRDGVVKIWSAPRIEAAKQSPLQLEATLRCGGCISALAFSGRKLFAASLDGCVQSFDVSRTTINRAINGSIRADRRVLRLSSPVLCLAIDKGVVACGTATGEVMCFRADDIGANCAVDVWPAHSPARTRSVTFAHGAVFSGGSDGTIRFRSLKPRDQHDPGNDNSDEVRPVVDSFKSPSLSSTNDTRNRAAFSALGAAAGRTAALLVEDARGIEELLPRHGGQVGVRVGVR